MSYIGIHYYRYTPSVITIFKQGGGSEVLSEGWYCMIDVLNAIKTLTNVIWDAQTNVITTSDPILIQSAFARDLLGWPAITSYYTQSNKKPNSTTVFSNVGFYKELSPLEVPGVDVYDTTYYTLADGKVFALGSVKKKVDTFYINLVGKKYIWPIEAIDWYTFSDVFLPETGNKFIISTGDNFSSISYSSSTAYNGFTCYHEQDPVITMKYSPFDKFFDIKMAVTYED